MRIALVSDWCLPRRGGIELQLRDLALQLCGRGHEVEIITPVEGPDTLDGVRVDGVRVHRLGVPRLPGAGIVYTAGAFRRIRELYVAGRYDVVHVHFGIIAPAAYGATFIAQQMGLPTVATFHSVLTHFGLPLGIVRGLMGVRDWRVQWTAVSSVVAESMRPLAGDAPVVVVPNGIDAPYWSQSRRVSDPAHDRHRMTDDRLRAVSVMRLHRRKRPFTLLDAIAATDRRATLEIIGDGPEMAAMRRAISRKGLEDVVSLAGWMPQHRVREALHGADVFLLPSRLEAFGIAALEARAAGLPVIAMSAGGVRDFLTHGQDALLAATDAEFAGHLRRLVTDRDLLERLRSGVAQPVAAGWDLLLPAIEKIYAAAGGECVSAASFPPQGTTVGEATSTPRR